MFLKERQRPLPGELGGRLGCTISPLRYFKDLQDPRPRHNRLHLFSDILVIAILAVASGAEGWTDVQRFAQARRELLKTFLGLPNGIPSHDTFGRVLSALDPEQFERCFRAWTKALAQATAGRTVSFDGKTLRRSFDRANRKAAIHMVSAWCGQNRLVLGQLATEAKSNETKAARRRCAAKCGSAPGTLSTCCK